MNDLSTTRRGALILFGGLSAGCTTSLRDTGTGTPAADWTMFGGDAQNSGYAPGGRTPSDPAMVWDSSVAIEEGDILSTPLIDDGTVFIGAWNAVNAIDLGSGETRWTRDRTRNAGYLTPALVGSTVYFGELGVEDGAVSAVRTSDGDEEWRREVRPNASLTAGDGQLYVRAIDEGVGRLYCLDATTGQTEWTVDTSSDPPAVAASPALGSGLLYSVAPPLDGSGSEGAVALHGLDLADGSVQFQYGTDIQPRSNPAIAGNTVYVGTTDGVAAVGRNTGEERWRFEAGNGVRTSPATDGDVVCAVDTGNTLHALDAATGERRWRHDIGMWTDALRSHPTLTDDAVVVGGDQLAAFDRGGGDRWTFDLRGTTSSAFTAPAVVGDTVISAACHKTDAVQNYDNSVYALK